MKPSLVLCGDAIRFDILAAIAEHKAMMPSPASWTVGAAEVKNYGVVGADEEGRLVPSKKPQT